jgi:hypothetical protein
VFLVNSRSHHFIATPSSSESKSLHRRGRTFSRSYGTNLPSSFTRVLSSALGFSPHPPVSVYGTVHYYLMLRSFSWKHGINHFSAHRPMVSYLDIKNPDLPKLSAYILSPRQPTLGRFSLLRHSIAVIVSTGILTSFPSTTPFGLALGADSPCAD